MQTFTVPQPPTLNVLLDQARTNKFTAAKSKKMWTTKCQRIAAKELKPYPLGTRIWIIPEFQYSTSASDPDNLVSCLKPVLDGMVQAKVLHNDSLKVIQSPLLCEYVKVKRGVKKFTTLKIFDNEKEYYQFAKSIIDKILL